MAKDAKFVFSVSKEYSTSYTQSKLETANKLAAQLLKKLDSNSSTRPPRALTVK